MGLGFIAIVTVLSLMLNPLPAKNVDEFNAKFEAQMKAPKIEAVYKFNK